MEFLINHGQKFVSLFHESIELFLQELVHILQKMKMIYLLPLQVVLTKGINVSLLISNPLSGRNVGSTFTGKSGKFAICS